MNEKFFKRSPAFLKPELLSVKLTTLVAIGLLTCTSQHSFAQQIQVDGTKKPLKTVLKQIEDQSGYSFVYDADILENDPAVQLALNENGIKEALAKLSTALNVEYKIVNKTITLTKPKVKQGSTVLLKGRVVVDDQDGKTAANQAGVSVALKGTSKVIGTDNRGEFNIVAPVEGTLIISYIGYKSQEIPVKEIMKNSRIVLEKSMDYLDEVIVTAYGTKESRENQTGSAFVITRKELENRPTLRLDALLEGIIPGVEFNSQDAGTNSSARSRYSTRIRGESSTVGGTTSNEPLWVVDGVPLYTGGTTNSIPGMQNSISPLTYINPNDIESVTVLKDASATTIYGANGSNGVILITTRKGKGAPKLNYTFRSGINKRPTTYLNQLNGLQYLNLVKDMGMMDQLGKLDTNQNTNWADVYNRTGLTTLHNVSLSGSTDAARYFLAANVYDEKHMIIGNTTKRYDVRSNVSGNVGKRLIINSTMSASYTKDDMFNPGNAYFQYSPLISPYGPNGSYIERDPNGNLLQNMPGLSDQNDQKQEAAHVLGSLGFSYQLMDGLKFTNLNGADFTSVNEDMYNSMYNYSGASSNGSAYRGQSQVLNLISTNTLTFDRKIFGGDFDFLLGTEARKEERRSVSATGSNFPNDDIREVGFVAVTSRVGTTSRDKQTLLSYFGRAGYVYDKRYAINYTYRKDGSSNFGKDVKWGTFSSVGAAWTASNESFWPKNKVIDFLKFKVSYGNNGNSRFNSSYASGIYKYDADYSYGGNSGTTMTRGVNDGLKWETTKMLNTGIDFRLFERFNIAAEYYRNVTHDMIDNAYVSMVTGFRRTYENVGKMQNTGLELSVNGDIIKKEKFNWSASFILSSNRNKVLELNEDIDRVSGTTIMRPGYNSRSYYLVRWAGVDPSTGDPMWYDVNGNITKTFNTNDRVIAGDATHKYYGGLTNYITYDNWNFSVFFKYAKGGLYFDQAGRNNGLDGLSILSGNQSIDMLNSWRFPGQLATSPRLSNTSTSSIMNSTRFLLDRTYLKLDNISLGYTFKAGLIERLKLSHISVTAMASNLAIWTPYSAKKGTIKNYEALAKQYGVTSSSVVDNTYANMLSESSRVLNYSLNINIGF